MLILGVNLYNYITLFMDRVSDISDKCTIKATDFKSFILGFLNDTPVSSSYNKLLITVRLLLLLVFLLLELDDSLKVGLLPHSFVETDIFVFLFVQGSAKFTGLFKLSTESTKICLK